MVVSTAERTVAVWCRRRDHRLLVIPLGQKSLLLRTSGRGTSGCFPKDGVQAPPGAEIVDSEGGNHKRVQLRGQRNLRQPHDGLRGDARTSGWRGRRKEAEHGVVCQSRRK